MTDCRPRWSGRCLLIGLAVWLAGAATASAAFTLTVGDPIVVGYVDPTYVIDSDEERADPVTYHRHLIPARVVVTVQKTGVIFESVSIRAGFRLINDTTGAAVTLASAVDTPPRVYATIQGVATSIPGVYVRNFDVNLQPLEALDPYVRYRIEVDVTAAFGGPYTPVDNNLSTADYGFIHLRGTLNTDLQRNVVAVLEGIALGQRFIVDTDPGNDEFSANVSFRLHRYDDTLDPIVSTPITVRFQIELLPRDSGGVVGPPIALANTTVVVSPDPTINSWALSIAPPYVLPVTQLYNRTLRFRPGPGVQLDSVTKDYALRATISHLELPILNLYATGNTRTTTFERLLHFNGKLSFGAINTTMTSIVNDPVLGAVFNAAEVVTTMGFGSPGGYLDGKPTFTYGPGNVTAALQLNGDALCQAGSSIALNPPVSPDFDEISRVRFRRGPMTLSPSGVTASTLTVILPAGLGYASDKLDRSLFGDVTFPSVALNQMLHPISDQIHTPAGPMWVTEETKPVSVRVNSLRWVVNAGRFDMPTAGAGEVHYVRTDELDLLEASPAPPVQKLKFSNEAYYRWVNAVGPILLVDTDITRGAQLTAEFDFAGLGRTMIAHFPYLAAFRGENGHMSIVADQIDPVTSYLDTLVASPGVALPISADCVEPGCGSTADTISRLLPDGNRLRMTQEGGLVAEGPLQTPLPLQWGWIPTLGRFAHQTSQFVEGRVHLAGHFMRGPDATVTVNLRPASVLFVGADALTGVIGERPKTFAYATGNLDYAGLNFRSGEPRDATDSGMTGESTLGGGPYGPYPLKKRCKYYVRKSGISGIHDKVFGSPEQVFISGYDFTLNNFGLAFLSNENVDSRTEGSIFLPHPSDYTLEFEKLLFLCNGALDKATVSGGTQPVIADYWTAPLDVSAMEFTRDPAQLCNPGEGYLALGVAAYMAHVTDTLYGNLGVFAHGNLIPKGKGIPDLDSRFVAPSQVKLRGPKRAAPGATGYETYWLTPTAGAFLNVLGPGPDYPFPGSPPTGSLADGFMNLPALMKVSFFQAIEAHLQTASHRPPPNPDDPSPWGVADLPIANGAWSGKSFFTGAYHDPDNRAFPGTSAAQRTTYITSPTYFVHASQKWLGGAIELDYPVMWDFPTRSFRSVEPVTDNFLLVSIEQRVAYLSAERADVRFGAQVGLPQLNFANFLVNTLDDTSGMANAVTAALGAPLVNSLDEGLSRFNEILADRMESHYERFAGPALDSLTDTIYSHLQSNWSGNDWVGGNPPALDSFLVGGASTLRSSILLRLGASPAFTGGGLNQVQQLQQQLDKVLDALDDFTGPGGLLEEAGGGGVQTGLIQTLVRNLIEELAGEVNDNLASVVGAASAAALNELMGPYLERAEPTLDQVRAALLEVRDAVAAARDKLNGGEEFLTEVGALHTTALTGEFSTLGNAIKADLDAYLNTYGPAKKLTSVSATAVKTKIRQAITDRLYGTAFMADVQTAIKQRVFDVNVAMRTGLDSAFGQVNEVVKGALSSALLDLDTAFAGVLGSFGGAMATAGLDGYALFNGDALKKVRIDGKVQWSIPEKTGFTAYIEVNQFQSGPDEGYCGDPGVDAAEVIVGADDVPCDFLSPDLRVNVFTKITFDTGGNTFVPVNFAGGFEMAEGEITFEAFAITDLAAAVAFGEFENYISCALGLRFNSYKAKGGIFFGRTCTLQPIMMWDLFVAEALGQPNPTFTGGYVYGECHIPVSEAILGIPASCFFQVTAGMGLGVFYFVEGPTYGARGALAVGGDALCILSLNGRLDMTGLKQGSKFKLNGKGTVSVEIGVCPLCVEASRSVKFSAETGGGKSKGGNPSVK